MPVWAWRSAGECHDCALLVSHDNAATWSPGPVIAHGDNANGLQYRETAVHVLPSGKWLAICRANQPNYHGAVNVTTHGVVSADGGQTWSPPFPYLAALGYPRLTPMPDGGLMATGTTGEVIRALFSHSEGDSWDAEEILYLRDGRESLGLLDCGSASAVAIDEDHVLVVYYATQDQRHDFGTRIRLVNRIESVWLQRFGGDSMEVIGR